MKYNICILFILMGQNAFGQAFCPLDRKSPTPKGLNSYHMFKSIAILDEGRIKPLDTYAENLLLKFSGKRTFNKRPAVDWTIKLLFAPAATVNDKVFLINNPEIPVALGMDVEEKRRYSYAQIQLGYSKLFELAKMANSIDEKERVSVDQEILRVFENVRHFAELSHVFEFAFPHPDFEIVRGSVREKLQLPKTQQSFSFLDIALSANFIRETTARLTVTNMKEWDGDEKELMRLLAGLFQWSMMSKDLPFNIIPAVDESDEIWLSPWDAISNSFHSEQIQDEIVLLRDMVFSYWNGSQIKFDISTRAFNHAIRKNRSSGVARSLTSIPLELFYNKINPLLYAKICYGLTFLMFLLSLGSPRRVLYPLSLGMLLGGFILHTSALIMRIVIMGRPPVSNLFETFVFVGFISVFLGTLIEWMNKKWLGIMVASFCGFVFLMIASKFSMEGDTMKMLVAVLNSNFWLGTHVLSITMGYAGCCVAGVIGHAYILNSVFKPKDKKQLDAIYKNLMGALGFGLAMTFLGTNLGGIWADESWGRFWGWDPKENGALLIILWTAILFHAKIARLIGPLGVAVGSVLGIIVVVWAWFGVNLLSVGLHSYGFTSGIAMALISYVLIQILFLSVTVPLAMKRLK